MQVLFRKKEDKGNHNLPKQDASPPTQQQHEKITISNAPKIYLCLFGQTYNLKT